MEGQRFDYAVVGGGVYGLCAAYHLAQSGAEIALFERFTIGHTNGSSHGPTRITRQAYPLDYMAELSGEAMLKYWPEMEKSLQSKLLYKNDFLFVTNHSELFKPVLETSKKFPLTQRQVTIEQLRQKFPSFPALGPEFQIIQDAGASIIAARDFVSRLGENLKGRKNVAIFQNTEVKQIRDNNKNVTLVLESEQIQANKIVVTAGKWASDIVPEVKDLLAPVQQHYAQVELHDMSNFKIGRFPSLQYQLKEAEFYMLPDQNGEGLKFGLQLHKPSSLSPGDIENIIEKAAREFFGEAFKQIIKYEVCQYTNSRSQEFLIDWTDPENQNILVCSCCSGHGFKFSPLLGKVCSDLLISNKSIASFEKNRHAFQIVYHQGINLE